MLTARRNILTGAGDLPFGTSAQTYRIKLAAEAWELRGYAALRRRTFCEEQGLFDGSDHDEHDVLATPIVAVSYAAVCDDEVIGCVRIFPTDDSDTWYGSRLSVDPEWRGATPLVAGLIRAAVCTAHARGCRRFLANVQRQNAPLFRRLHWHGIEELDVRGRPHLLMRADLSHYPPRAVSIESAFEPKRVAS
ncbi:MAG TPA: MSMEG_0567/Sll0786 family nitrogen starvation N-acetyltransferase [Tepidisphaeraceae bacterium]|nr:MSMEG_0567/Sll0786 family nitrogen starvation N-acetyltransferase [Tepidisphaeraceae bacterium]